LIKVVIFQVEANEHRNKTEKQANIAPKWTGNQTNTIPKRTKNQTNTAPKCIGVILGQKMQRKTRYIGVIPGQKITQNLPFLKQEEENSLKEN
jgi:hypothetical protein